MTTIEKLQINHVITRLSRELAEVSRDEDDAITKIPGIVRYVKSLHPKASEYALVDAARSELRSCFLHDGDDSTRSKHRFGSFRDS